MKKILSFLILFIPWNISLSIIYFSNLNFYSFIFILISFIFYLLFTRYIFKVIKYDLVNNDFIYKLLLIYILNQSFNLCLFYYNFFILSFVLLISMIIILYRIKK